MKILVDSNLKEDEISVSSLETAEIFKQVLSERFKDVSIIKETDIFEGQRVWYRGKSYKINNIENPMEIFIEAEEGQEDPHGQFVVLPFYGLRRSKIKGYEWENRFDDYGEERR